MVDKNEIVEVVSKASASWQTAFNAGDAEGCAAHYEENAYVEAKPFGVFNGREAVTQLWNQIISGGFTDVEYMDTKIEVIDDESAILSAKWKMNKAHGIITKELWVIQPDGSALLREDFFEVTS